MKIITESVYKELIKKDEKCENCTQKNETLKELIREKEILVQEQKREIKNAKEDAIAEIKEEKDKLKLENGNLNKENEVLKKAFENLGFDVKDMKQILNKLVDGVISKNTVNVVK